MASPKGLGQSPFTKTQMEKITTLVRDALKTVTRGDLERINKTDLVAKVKTQVIRDLGSVTRNIESAVVEKTVLNVIEEVWTDMAKIWGSAGGSG